MIKFELSLKQAVDHYLGGAIAWVLNILAQIAGPILRRDHTFVVAPRAVLFLKFVGLGSIIRASFLFDSAKEAYPGSKILFATSPGCAPLAQMYPQIDEVIVVRDHSLIALALDTVKLIVAARLRGVDLVIDLEVHSKYSSIVSALSLAANRAGFAGVTSRFRRGLYTHLVFWNPLRFVGHAYEQLGLALGWQVNTQGPTPVIQESATREAQSYLVKLGIDPETLLIGINPNASELKIERRWPAEQFAELIRNIPAHKPAVILLLGSKAEASYVEGVLALCKDSQLKVHNTAGALSFAGFCALLRRLSILVANDSGPLHLARAFSVPTVSLWGPTHPISYSPRGSKHISVYRPIYCSPCTHLADTPPCGGDNQCLKQIPWTRVYRAVMQLLEFPVPERIPVALEANRELVYGYWKRASVSPPQSTRVPNKNIRREVVGE